MNRPNLFVIGAPKSGTSAFVQQLAQYPDIFIPKIKEPRYFDAHTFFDYESDYPIKNEKEYLSLYDTFDANNSVYRVDGSVFNMYSEESIKRIIKLSPQAKFIVILRDPLSASKSMHLQRLKYYDVRMREVSIKFCECWDLLELRKKGSGFPKDCRNKILFRYDLLYRYELYLPFIQNLINKDKILFIKYDVFRDFPQMIHTAVQSFLELPEFNPEVTKVNESYIVKPDNINKLCGYIAKNTLMIRKPFGFTGDSLRWIKNLYQEKYTVRVSTESCDNRVRDYFCDSYCAMNEVLEKYDFNVI
ncbi:MAG: sulfotransferase [Chlorobium sp.]|jgi:hypothetical protein|nr:sulfotransferase [Chlorobium sp.]